MFAKHFIIILWIYITKAEVKEKPDNKMVPKQQSGRESRTLGHIAGKVLMVTLKYHFYTLIKKVTHFVRQTCRDVLDEK